MLFWDPHEHEIIANHFDLKEDYVICVDFFVSLREQGMLPTSITMDGNTLVIKAIRKIWPDCTIQRCVYHIQRQGQMWLRRYPKSGLAFDLKLILSLLPRIKTHQQKDQWWEKYYQWKFRYQDQIKALDSHHKVDSDIIRTYRMIENASKDMFHYLDNPDIPSTSNGLESYFSRLKDLYKRHRGLRKSHLENYLAWYIHWVKTQN